MTTIIEELANDMGQHPLDRSVDVTARAIEHITILEHRLQELHDLLNSANIKRHSIIANGEDDWDYVEHKQGVFVEHSDVQELIGKIKATVGGS